MAIKWCQMATAPKRRLRPATTRTSSTIIRTQLVKFVPQLVPLAQWTPQVKLSLVQHATLQLNSMTLSVCAN